MKMRRTEMDSVIILNCRIWTTSWAGQRELQFTSTRADLSVPALDSVFIGDVKLCFS